MILVIPDGAAVAIPGPGHLLPRRISEAMLPFFVYGSLLPGQPNFTLWGQALLDTRPAVYTGGVLYDLGAYPMLIEEGAGRVSGRVMYVTPADYTAVMQRLDSLEGYDPDQPERAIFRRVQRWVTLSSGAALPVWLYLGRPELTRHAPVVPDGDWARYSAGRLADMQSWWDNFGRHLSP